MLLPGMWVEVLPASEIAGTLDAEQCLGSLPFMPEMLPYCGRRFRVALRAERTCVHPPEIPFRRLEGAVVLEGLRCDGSLHGDCQLGCMLFWKEGWLRRVPANEGGQATGTLVAGTVSVPEMRATRRSDPGRYFCQATALRRATTPGEPLCRPGQYLRFLRVRTYAVPELLAMLIRTGSRRFARLLRPKARDAFDTKTQLTASLGLQAGEWVEVRSRAQILQTLDARRTYEGFSFGGDMYDQCGRRMRVSRRVDRLMDEETGKLRAVPDTVILEGSVCDRYFGCARQIPFQWKELWLKRAETVPSAPDIAAGTKRRLGS
jgi:hypothetical protein